MARSRKDVGHVLVIASLDPGMTPKAHWTMIKDDIRSLCPTASKGPGHVHMHRYSCTVDMLSQENAETVFAKITMAGLPKLRGSRLLVHYVRTHPKNKTEIVACNGTDTACRDGRHTVGEEDYFGRVQAAQYHGGYGYMSTMTTTGPVAVMPTYGITSAATCSIPYTASNIPEYTSQYGPIAAGHAYYMQQEVVRTVYTVPATPYQQLTMPNPPAIHTNYATIPSAGLSNGVKSEEVDLESNGIHISHLSYKVSEDELKKFIKRHVQPYKVMLKRDENRKSKGLAVVTFRTPSEALIAQARLDGRELRGYKMKVKLDREMISSTGAGYGPVIANGSTLA